MRPMLNNYDLINEGLNETLISNEEVKATNLLDILNDRTIGWKGAEKLPTGKRAMVVIEKALKNPLRCYKCSEIFAIDLTLTPLWLRNTFRNRSEEVKHWEARGFRFIAQRISNTQYGEGMCRACQDEEISTRYYRNEYHLNGDDCCYEQSHGYPCVCQGSRREEMLDENDMEPNSGRQAVLQSEREAWGTYEDESECERQWRLQYMADMVHAGVESEENYQASVREHMMAECEGESQSEARWNR